MQSLNLVYFSFKYETHSFVIKIALDVNRAVLDDIIKPTPRFKIDKGEGDTVAADTIKISVININTFLLIKLLYFFLY